MTPPQGESGPSAEPKVARLLLPFHGNPSRKIESLYASKACIFPSSEAKQYRNGPSPSLTSKVLFKTSAVKLVEFITQLFCTSEKMKALTSVFVVLNLVFPLVRSHSESHNDFPFDTCSIEKKSCEIHEDNLIESFTVTDLEECRQLCGYLENCQYFSHFGEDNFPFSNLCILFSSCPVLYDCGEDCYTEDRLCHGSCGRNFESKQDYNVIELIPDVELERNCKGICLADADCLYYTYYGRKSDHNPNLCILLSDLPSPSQECEHCVSSLPNCKNTSYISCKFTSDSDQTLNDSRLFTNIDDTINVDFSPSASLGCKATIIAIGGGGDGESYGGGGSGYVKSNVIDVSSTKYQVSVGQYGQDSVFRLKNGQNVLTAQAGGDGDSYDSLVGGDGYSGGGSGGYNGGGEKGGSDGSDGNGSYRGSGSIFDISTISLKYHTLSPGNGGEPIESFGGGGGGVLVDNVGPAYGTHQGQGYGGGGGYNQYHGLQGMVLIEANPKP